MRLMKSHTEYLTFTVPARMGFVNITPQRLLAVTKVHAPYVCHRN